ncbi:MAG: hypothetical protein JST54_10265 [Deltaproteobacteria bacterium]|nr:hypothetical protein [Deltaproteobacteria bacterium]
MSKVLVGCGLVMLVLGALVFGGFYFLHHKQTELTQVAVQMRDQESQYALLEQKYPFIPPGPGEPVQLSESRLATYLQVRSVVLPVYTRYVEHNTDLSVRARSSGKVGRLADELEDTDVFTEKVTQLQATYLRELDQARMSPKEFLAITRTVYGTMLTAAVSQERKAMEMQIRQLGDAARNASPEMARQLNQQQATIKTMLAGMPDPGNAQVFAANTVILGRSRESVTRLTNGAFDAFLAQADASFARVHGGPAPTAQDLGQPADGQLAPPPTATP